MFDTAGTDPVTSLRADLDKVLAGYKPVLPERDFGAELDVLMVDIEAELMVDDTITGVILHLLDQQHMRLLCRLPFVRSVEQFDQIRADLDTLEAAIGWVRAFG